MDDRLTFTRRSGHPVHQRTRERLRPLEHRQQGGHKPLGGHKQQCDECRPLGVHRQPCGWHRWQQGRR